MATTRKWTITKLLRFWETLNHATAIIDSIGIALPMLATDHEMSFWQMLILLKKAVSLFHGTGSTMKQYNSVLLFTVFEMISISICICLIISLAPNWYNGYDRSFLPNHISVVPLRKQSETPTCVYSISQEIFTRFLLCCALLLLYIDWFSHIHQAYFNGTVAI